MPFHAEKPLENIIVSDITRGLEKHPIRCVSFIDEDSYENDFHYITKNLETTTAQIGRNIHALTRCDCKIKCNIKTCACAKNSKFYRYKKGLLAPLMFNNKQLLYECNALCGCNIATCGNRVTQLGMTCRLELNKTVDKGWGVRTLKPIPKGTFVAEYLGEIISNSEADTRSDDSYLFDLGNYDQEFCLDARQFGNISRFINHTCDPNLIPVNVLSNRQQKQFPNIAFFSLRYIKQYEELGFDYGENFWVIKRKIFPCQCKFKKCKYK